MRPCAARSPVHPRACGEHLGSGSSITLLVGSSPRLRGTLSTRRPCTMNMRFIPAPAGNTRTDWWLAEIQSVHPRACGEHNGVIEQDRTECGSSPRLRGTRLARGWRCWIVRFIPAPAGNTRGIHLAHDLLHGSSPRLRGTRSGFQPGQPACRFIPAPAGNTSPGRPCGSWRAVHPRACGEHGEYPAVRQEGRGSSPRLRGTQHISRMDRM